MTQSDLEPRLGLHSGIRVSRFRVGIHFTWNRFGPSRRGTNSRPQRDENGVPHVEAPSWREALYAWGYMHAIDRPTQVYFARAVASGQAAERIANKPELLEMDIFLRRAGLYRDLDREFRRLPEAHARAARLVLPGRERRPARRGPHAADVGHRLSPAAVGADLGHADRQAAELRRPHDRRAGKRAAAAGVDSTGRRRRAAARAVSPVSRRHRFRAAPRDSRSPSGCRTKRWSCWPICRGWPAAMPGP